MKINIGFKRNGTEDRWVLFPAEWPDTIIPVPGQTVSWDVVDRLLHDALGNELNADIFQPYIGNTCLVDDVCWTDIGCKVVPTIYLVHYGNNEKDTTVPINDKYEELVYYAKTLFCVILFFMIVLLCYVTFFR